jgi:sugar lactone lactonase YvrE
VVKSVSSSPSVIWEFKAQLGEGPVWDDQKELLYWLDIKGRQLLSLDTKSGNRVSVGLSTEVSAVALRSRGGLVAATKKGFALLNPETGKLSFIVDPEVNLPGNRFNDGKCDSAGNFIAGTMDEQEERPMGTMYRLDADLSAAPLFGEYIVCNGPAFSPDGRSLYFSNSTQREILEFDYDPEKGLVGNSSVFARIPDTAGYPDGLSVDAEGYIWCAHWDGWRVTRYAPDGREDVVVDFPVPRVTSCVFGGRQLDTLFVTTARTGLDDSVLDKAPLSGSLFAFRPGVSGLAAQRFAG